MSVSRAMMKTFQGEMAGSEEHVCYIEIVSREHSGSNARVWCCEAFCSFCDALSRTLRLWSYSSRVHLLHLLLSHFASRSSRISFWVTIHQHCDVACRKDAASAASSKDAFTHLGSNISSRLTFIAIINCTLENNFSHQAREKKLLLRYIISIFSRATLQKEKETKKRGEKIWSD